MKKLLFLVLTILLSVSSLRLSAQMLTVADGTAENEYIPYYGFWMDVDQHNQIIYPESMLTDLVGESITGLIFYLSEIDNPWGSTTTLSLGTTTSSSFASSALNTSPVTAVYSGPISIFGNQISFSFATPFVYNGGNLLLDITSIGDNYSSAYFYGVSQSNASLYSYNSTMNRQSFIPKTSFLYGSCLPPTQLTMSNIGQTSATVSWTAAAGANMWEVYCGTGGEDLDNVSWSSASDTSYSLTGLSPNTQYVVYVRSNCGSEYSYAVNTTFRTECGITPVPFAEGFESQPVEGTPTCWTILNSYSLYGSSYPQVYDYSGHTGSNCFLMALDPSSVNGTQLAVLPQLAAPIDELQVSLYAFMDSYNPIEHLYIGYITDLTNANSFVPVATYGSSSLTGDEYSRFVASFSNVQVAAGTVAYIAIGVDCAPTTSLGFLGIDDILVDYIPACSEPVALTAQNITATTAQVSWNPGTTTAFNIYYKSHLDTAYSEILYVSDSTYLLENLTPSAAYQWYVAAVCDDGSVVNSEMASFNTSCSAITNLPYFTDFESLLSTDQTLPYCWIRGNNSTYPSIYDFDAYSGDNCLEFYTANTVALPQLDLDEILLANVQLSFYGMSSISDNVELQVGVMTNPNQPSTFVQVGNSFYLDSDNYQLFEVDFSTYTGTGSYIAFKNVQSTSLYIDDVTIDYLPDCVRPNTVYVTSVDTASAVIGWSTLTGQTAWEVVMDTAGFDPDEATAIAVTTNSYEFQGLTSNTAYDVYVRTDCGGEYSDWSNVLNFVTLPASPAQIPYTCDFENPTENASWVLLNNEQTNKWVIDTAANNTANGNYGLYISQDSGATNTYNISASSISWAYRDIVFTGANEFLLSFDWRTVAESNWDFVKVFIGSPVPVQAGSATAPANSVQIGQFSGSSEWTQCTATLGGSYANTTRRLFFMWKNDSSMGTNPAGAIDNISITPVLCAQPVSVQIDELNTDNATFTIVPASSNDSEWEVVYGTSDTTMTSIIVNSTTNTLTNLLPATHYYISARTLCSGGDTSAWSPVATFQTECVLLTTVPQTWDMESNNTGGSMSNPLPACWTRGSANSTYPYVYSTNGHNAPHSLYFYNAYKNVVAMPVIDTDELPINTLQVSFYAKASSVSSYDAQILVGVLSDVSDLTTFTVVDTIDLTDTYPTYPYVVLFNNYTGTGNRIAFKNSYTTSYAYNDLYVDDVTLEAIPSCIPVSNLSLTGSDETSLTVTWTPGSTEDSWYLEYKEQNDSVWTNQIVTSIPYTISGLDAATGYDIRVQSDCGGGDLSTWSYLQANTTLCDSASQCTYTFYLSDSYGDGWNGAAIAVYQNGVLAGEVRPSYSFHTITMTLPLCDNFMTSLVWLSGNFDSEASFYVTDPFGEVVYTTSGTPSGTLTTFMSACTPPSCPAPTSIAVANIGSTSADVSWVSAGTETAWNVEYKLATDTAWTEANVTTNPYTLTGLTAGTAYDVRVQADCGAGEVSTYKETSFNTSICDVADQCAYTFILGDGYGDGWNDGYLTVQQSGTTIAILEAVDHGGEGDYTYYDTVVVYLCDNLSTSLVWSFGDFDDEVSINIIGPDGTSVYTHEDFFGYTTYTFTTNCGGTTACDAPTALAVNGISQTSATATWTAGGTETSWNVEYKAASATTWQTATVSAATYTMTGLTPNTAYEVKVQAVCDASTTSDWTTAVSFTTLNEDTPTCPAPTGLAATVDHTDATLTWNQEANTATEWQINYRQTTESSWSTVTATTTSYTLTDLVANVTYEANVVAHCDNGLTSDPSNTVTFETNNNSVQTYLEKSVSLYPNPATEMVSVAVSDANIQISSVEVYNVYGQLISVIESNDNPLRINVSGLADGMYYVRVTTDNGVVTKNFVKR
ncbi:MAG: fibronectin type III domain-containing protein [Bacteroidales bacterium]|nr:fibronectin type III domain-containing protein [Bacteroidales bacterium]